MDSIIGLKQANCKNCYKCIRNCPVKSIAYKNENAQIMSADCIYCGKCLLICPQNAKYINSDMGKVKESIRKGEKLYVSLAPSYISAFPQTDISKMSAALKKLGFTYIEETAIGAAQVTKEYEKLISEHKMKNIITTACPSVNLLVEKYYPELVNQLAPVVTPAVAHARMLKQIYGVRIKVVFIGPCVSKKYECIDPENNKSIYSVLTFNELNDWLNEEKIVIGENDKTARRIINTLPRLYPIPGGIIRNISSELRHKYENCSVDGASRCIETLDALRNENLSGYFFEMNICEGGCLGGHSFKTQGKSYLVAKSNFTISFHTENTTAKSLTENVKATFNKTYKDKSTKKPVVTEEQINEVFKKMGKVTPDKILNCGCCGYNSCREKAIAVVEGKADIKMCVPHMRELAESMSNTVVEHSPIGTIILDEKLNIDQINPAAIDLIGSMENYIGKSIVSLFDSEDFYEVLSKKKNIINHKIYYKNLDKYVSQSVVYVDISRVIIVLISDITSEEKVDAERRKIAKQSADFANDVINKQIQVVQQITSLLGETTVSTQTALSELTDTLIGGTKIEKD